MPESQSHGKTWETDLALNVYKATEAELASVSHTAPMDVPSQFNRLDGIDLSVKVTGADAVDMGDIVRIFNEVSSGKPVHMAVIRYEQTATTKKLKSITEVDLTNSVTLLFGDTTLAQIEELVAYVKSIPHNGRTPEHQANYKRMAAALKKGLISYAPKVDSKTQRRVQGHFSKFRKFVLDNPSRLIAESDGCQFRGGTVKAEIVSPRRVRNKKPVSDLTPHSPPI